MQMGRSLKIEAHLSPEELYERYRGANNPIERTHCHILWLLVSGRSAGEVSQITGYSRNWLYRLVRRYNSLGTEGIGDQRRNNPGSQPLLNDEQQAYLYQALQEPAPDGGLWNGAKVARWMSQLLGREVSPQRGWEYLRGLDYRRLRPRPSHIESSLEEQLAWKKKLHATVEQLSRQYPEAKISVWGEDEHRVGLKPINRIVWAERGYPIPALVNWKFQYLWLVAFIHPASGENYWWMVPRLNSQIFSLLLADFARHFELGPKNRVILTLDRASFHTSDCLQIPEGIHLLHMPAKSPELQPAERLWPLADEPLANRSFDSLDQLEDILESHLKRLLGQKERIRPLTFFHWWPDDRLSDSNSIPV